MMMEATTSGVMSVLCVVLFFSLATLGAMLTIVMLMYYGTELVAFKPLERYGHAIAGLIVLACGLAIQFGL